MPHPLKIILNRSCCNKIPTPFKFCDRDKKCENANGHFNLFWTRKTGKFNLPSGT